MVRRRGEVGRRGGVVQSRDVRQMGDEIRARWVRLVRHSRRESCEWDAWAAGRRGTGPVLPFPKNRLECAEDSCQDRWRVYYGRRLVCRAECRLQRLLRWPWVGPPRLGVRYKPDGVQSAASPCGVRAEPELAMEYGYVPWCAARAELRVRQQPRAQQLRLRLRQPVAARRMQLLQLARRQSERLPRPGLRQPLVREPLMRQTQRAQRLLELQLGARPAASQLPCARQRADGHHERVRPPAA